MEHFLTIRRKQKIVAVTLWIGTLLTCNYIIDLFEAGSSKNNQATIEQLQSSLCIARRNRLSVKEADRFHQSTDSQTRNNQLLVTSEPNSSLIGQYVHPGNPLPNYILIGRTQGLSSLDYRKGAMMFVHHNKAAGSSIKTCLNNMYNKKILKHKPVIVSETQIFNVNARLQNGSLSNYDLDVFMGDYDFGLCRHFTTRNCSYFTFLRDPVDRVISSYFYCLGNSGDQLCGPIPPQSLTIQEWAVYQGSYFFHQLLVDPAICRWSWGRFVPCWFKEKTYYAKKLTAGDKRRILNVILDNMDKWFSVIGLTEEYQTSLAMISYTYNYSFSGRGCNIHYNKWHKKGETSKIDSEFQRNQNRSHDETKQAMRTLIQNDPDVMKALEFDIKIYDVGKLLFQRQKELLKGND